MVDGPFGAREILVDLTVTGARVLRNATKAEVVKIETVQIAGDPGASGSDIVLRSESASGPIFFKFDSPGAGIRNEEFIGPAGPINGLYLDNIGTGWVAGAVMVIRTR